MTVIDKTDDQLGFDINDLRPTAASVTLGVSAPPQQLPARPLDGFPLPAVAEQDQRAALQQLGITTSLQAFTKHVHLDMRQAFVAGKGYLRLIRFSHIWADLPRADWVSWLDIAGYGGFVEMWFNGLTANKQYFFDIAVTGWWRNSSSAFKVGSSGGFYANFPTSQSYQVQHLYGIVKPTSSMCLVRLEPIQLDGLSFYHTDLYPL